MSSQAPPNFANMDETALKTAMLQMWQNTQNLQQRLDSADAAYSTLNTNYTQLQGQHTALQTQVNTAALNPNIHVTAPLQQVPGTQTQAAPHIKSPKVPKPEAFKGERGPAARGFIQACEMYFLIRPDDFADQSAQIQFALMLLQDRAARWSQPIVQEILGGKATNRSSQWKEFRKEFESAFFDPDEKRTAAQRLLKLHQTKSTAEYASEFREIIAVLDWKEEAQLMHTYYTGLKNHVKDELAKTDDPATLDDLVKSSIKIDNRHWSREKEKKDDAPSHKPTPRPTPRYDPPKPPVPSPHWSSTAPGPAPMDLSATTSRALTPAEKKRRFDLGLCLYCGGNDHKRSGCEALKKSGGVARAAMARAIEQGTEEQSGKEEGL